MSRTDAEKCVRAGRVRLNGAVMLDPERPASPERDQILLDGKPLRPARKLYIALHKPVGCITTAHDPEGRRTAYDLLPEHAGNLQAVGRLDADSSGLLLFTNDPEFAARITDAAGKVEKVYEARVKGRVEARDARKFEIGVVLDGKPTLPAKCRVIEAGDHSSRVEVIIREGRNRQVRRMWDALGFHVIELHRTRIGPISLGGLPTGHTRVVREFERATLLVDPHLT
jgi:23S rRNA pseudouridine2605 synthase